mmetsp:Transcript_27302/g.78660  ORF Transcript_27302/g.78660 Transcript_27302/m.78660 type:complete len:247 (-) Transcript_27302:8-748(-)
MAAASTVPACEARPTLRAFADSSDAVGCTGGAVTAGACSTAPAVATIDFMGSLMSCRRSSSLKLRASASSARCSRTSLRNAAPESQHHACAASRCWARPRAARNCPRPFTSSAAAPAPVTFRRPAVWACARGGAAAPGLWWAAGTAGAVSVRFRDPRAKNVPSQATAAGDLRALPALTAWPRADCVHGGATVNDFRSWTDPCCATCWPGAARNIEVPNAAPGILTSIPTKLVSRAIVRLGKSGCGS